jgi:hypothetical protein
MIGKLDRDHRSGVSDQKRNGLGCSGELDFGGLALDKFGGAAGHRVSGAVLNSHRPTEDDSLGRTLFSRFLWTGLCGG